MKVRRRGSQIVAAINMKAIEKVRKEGWARGRGRGGQKKESLHLGTNQM